MGPKLTSSSDEMTAQLVSQAMTERHSSVEFVTGETPIPVVGKVFGELELTAAVQASLDF